MKILIVDTYYQEALCSFYKHAPELGRQPYDEQWQALMMNCFGTANFYSLNLKSMGHEAVELVANCRPLQQQWAREHGLRLWGRRHPLKVVLAEQIRRYRPDVLYIQNPTWHDAAFLREFRDSVGLVVGQLASCLFPDVDYGIYDLLLTSLPHYVEVFRALGVESEYLPLAFESSVLSRLEPTDPIYDVTFVGGFTGAHETGRQLLEYLAERTTLNVWGYGADTLPPNSSIRRNFHDAVWGIDMYRVLARSRIVLNRHAEFAGRFANNMRLYEATGVGSCLLTDVKDNLGDLFEAGREVAVYRNQEDCVEQVKSLLADVAARNTISHAGQARTLRQHTFSRRMQETIEVIGACRRRPRRKYFSATIARVTPVQRLISKGADLVRPCFRVLPYSARSPILSVYRRLRRLKVDQVSENHRPIEPADLGDDAMAAWQNSELPAKQRSVVQTELLHMYLGQPVPAFQAAAEAVRATRMLDGSILEVGCASGYYYEVLSHLLGRGIQYCGTDYSHPMLTRGRHYYKNVQFVESDATALSFKTGSIDTVFSGGVLLHLRDYESSIKETARVARHWCIFHRTPVVKTSGTRSFCKLGYGIPMLEYVFNESELLGAFEKYGLTVTATFHAGSHRLNGMREDIAVQTYLCRKVN